MVDPGTGAIAVDDLIPEADVAYPSGATHINFTGALALVDFEAGVSEIHVTETVSLPIDMTVNQLVLTPDEVPAGNGTLISMLKIEFLQEMNGVQYPLKNGSYNTLAIIDVRQSVNP